MNITVAKTAGFCMGVRRAVEMALDASNRADGPIFTYGPLIHNPQVLNILAEKGISVIRDIPEHGSGTVLIRAHGVPPQQRDRLRAAGFTVIDATCPKVIKVQSIIAKHAREGAAVIIIGDRAHPEVIGLLGYAGNNGHVAETMEDLEGLPVFETAIIVAQTTQNKAFFERVARWAEAAHPHYRIFNTICDSTESRQADVQHLAEKVDAVVVVGGRESGNTRRLFDIAAASGKPAVHIETEAELDLRRMGNPRSIGITAGASTPNWIIRRVYREIENQMMGRHRGLQRLRFAFQRNLLLSNVYLTAGAGCLTVAAARLQGLVPSPAAVGLAMLYLFCMHTFNNLMDISSDRFNDPDRAAYFQKNRHLLSGLTILSGLLGLVLAAAMGPLFLLLLVCMSFMGMVYIINLMPRALAGKFQPKIRDIPGSKTVLVALAWGIVTTLVPAIDGFGHIRPVTVLVFAWAGGLVFVRTAFFDILDMQGSRIVGKETIPILLGEKRTMALLKNLSGLMMMGLMAASLAGMVSTLGWVLSLCPLSMLVFLSAHEQGGLPAGLR
ncbi:MAG: 4-hydroxy-3-methylbut-2-enyl diphosphate reductase, partial [Desulfococcus multivorans]|nr:4-hydroxy-3-methylbut-2-enyl diphosphate reductase [Desulfococcus multivorans]